MTNIKKKIGGDEDHPSVWNGNPRLQRLLDCGGAWTRTSVTVSVNLQELHFHFTLVLHVSSHNAGKKKYVKVTFIHLAVVMRSGHKVNA
jgi:hypothetical protein